uniref:Uncharacterized protein n=1 Tax=Accipiter nisus TaxID=211598 RepID=A0A8B9MFK4_9AVES
MSYPQGYLYQPSASLALYSCPAYSTSVISGPRTDELGRSSSGSAFSPYAGSTAFTAPSPGYNSHLQYGTDPAAAAAAAFTSYVVRAAPGKGPPAVVRPHAALPTCFSAPAFGGEALNCCRRPVASWGWSLPAPASPEALPPVLPAMSRGEAGQGPAPGERQRGAGRGRGQALALPLPCHCRPAAA